MSKLYPLLLADTKEKIEQKSYSNTLTDNSLIANGFLRGNSFDEAAEAYMGNLLGDKVFRFFKGMLPYEVRLISSDKVGKVSVSPSDEEAVGRWLSLGKDRIFYILKASEDASLFLGFQKDMSAQELYELMLKGDIKSQMNECSPEVGEIYYVKAKTPFAIGKGVEVLEISQNSQVTLNIEESEQFAEALDFINLSKYIPVYEIPDEESVVMDTIILSKPNIFSPSELDSFVSLFVIEGKVSISSDKFSPVELEKQSLVILPHDMEDVTITPQSSQCRLLRVHLKGELLSSEESIQDLEEGSKGDSHFHEC